MVYGTHGIQVSLRRHGQRRRSLLVCWTRPVRPRFPPLPRRYPHYPSGCFRSTRSRKPDIPLVRPVVRRRGRLAVAHTDMADGMAGLPDTAGKGALNRNGGDLYLYRIGVGSHSGTAPATVFRFRTLSAAAGEVPAEVGSAEDIGEARRRCRGTVPVVCYSLVAIGQGIHQYGGKLPVGHWPCSVPGRLL